jgi:hypothetical protein
MRLLQVLLIVGMSGCVLGGCASGVDLTGDTLMLGEVRHPFTKEVMQSGRFDATEEPRDLSQFLNERGWTEEQLNSGRLLVVRVQIYWNNTVSGVVRNQLDVVLADDGQRIEPGNILEFTATRNVKRVRARTLAEGLCYYGNVPVGEMVELLGGLS